MATMTGTGDNDCERIPSEEGIGVVLAGGKSRRLGPDKRVLSVGGRTLLRRAVDALRQVFESVTVVSDAESVLQLPDGVSIERDRYPGRGPLAGIHAALSAGTGVPVFVAGCDMPFLNPVLIGRLFRMVPGHDAVVPRAHGKTQCLHAVYSPRCAAPAERLLAGDRRAVEKLLDEVEVRYVDEDELRDHDPELLSFFNVNTPEDLAEAENRAASLSN
jgi:molybdopterin-guanine dinucleotide biosynthesis protein A